MSSDGASQDEFDDAMPLKGQLPQLKRKLAKGTTIYDKARRQLHVSTVPEALPCRENELEAVVSALRSNIKSQKSGTLYISGVPGGGKTATTMQALNLLHEENLFDSVYVNGLKLTEPQQAFTRIWQELNETRLSAKQALDCLDGYFKKPKQKRRYCVLVVDELDLLVTKSQSVVYNLFDWPHHLNAKLTVVAIANTMDLPERVLTNRINSRLGMSRINFLPYTFQQLHLIIKARLEGILAFKDESIEFCARKVGAVSGDARRALDICRRALEIAHARDKKALVTLQDIDATIKEMYASSAIVAVQNLPKYEKIFIAVFMSVASSSSVPEIEYEKVIPVFTQFCKLNHMFVPNVLEITTICASLNSRKCITLEGDLAVRGKKMRLNLSEDDIKFALKDEKLLKKILSK